MLRDVAQGATKVFPRHQRDEQEVTDAEIKLQCVRPFREARVEIVLAVTGLSGMLGVSLAKVSGSADVQGRHQKTSFQQGLL